MVDLFIAGEIQSAVVIGMSPNGRKTYLLIGDDPPDIPEAERLRL